MVTWRVTGGVPGPQAIRWVPDGSSAQDGMTKGKDFSNDKGVDFSPGVI